MLPRRPRHRSVTTVGQRRAVKTNVLLRSENLDIYVERRLAGFARLQRAPSHHIHEPKVEVLPPYSRIELDVRSAAQVKRSGGVLPSPSLALPRCPVARATGAA
jgi:hypothetical protein